MSQTSHKEPTALPDASVRARQKPTTTKPEAPAMSKSDIVLKKLRGAKGASIQQLSEATSWQLHSVRGFLSATVRKKLGLNLVSDIGKDDVRRYRIIDSAGKASS